MIFDRYPKLENDRLVLKKMCLSDTKKLDEMMQDADVYRYVPTYLPELLSSDCETFIMYDCDRLFREHSAILLGIYTQENPEQFAGIAELYDYIPEENRISIGYRLRKDCWNRHIATSVVSLLKKYVFGELNIREITAHVMVVNRGSVRCVLNNGFVQRGSSHEEDWGMNSPVVVNEYGITSQAA